MSNNKETLEQKKRRLYGKKNMHSHITELDSLTNIDVNEKDLLSIVDSDLVLEKIKRYFHESDVKEHKHKIPFSDKESLLIFVGELIKLKDGEAYVMTENSERCGLLKIRSLKDFNVNFEREKAKSELFTITLVDFSNRLLLDINEEEGEYYLEIETYGDDWSKARLDE